MSIPLYTLRSLSRTLSERFVVSYRAVCRVLYYTIQKGTRSHNGARIHIGGYNFETVVYVYMRRSKKEAAWLLVEERRTKRKRRGWEVDVIRIQSLCISQIFSPESRKTHANLTLYPHGLNETSTVVNIQQMFTKVYG